MLWGYLGHAVYPPAQRSGNFERESAQGWRLHLSQVPKWVENAPGVFLRAWAGAYNTREEYAPLVSGANHPAQRAF